jgi:hypothetical protein
MYSATIHPEDFDISPWDNPFEEHKLGVGNVKNLSKQITNAAQTLKCIRTNLAWMRKSSQLSNCCTCCCFIFRNLSVRRPVRATRAARLVYTTITGTHLSLRLAVGPTQTVS